MIKSRSADTVGKVFFNMMKTPCFVFRTTDVCVDWSWWGGCNKYEKKRTAVWRDAIPYWRKKNARFSYYYFSFFYIFVKRGRYIMRRREVKSKQWNISCHWGGIYVPGLLWGMFYQKVFTIFMETDNSFEFWKKVLFFTLVNLGETVSDKTNLQALSVKLWSVENSS